MKEVLPKYNAITILTEIHTEGHSPLKVISEDGRVYFVKNNKGHFPDYCLISELLCYFFLQQWGIPTPIASIISVNSTLLQGRGFSNYHQKRFYEVPTVGSLQLENAYEINHLIGIHDKRDFNKFINPLDLLFIGFFDIWVENTDRKPSNPNLLVQVQKGGHKIYAIDHAFTFDSMSFENLNPKYISNTWNENILATKMAMKAFSFIEDKQTWWNQIEEKFYLCVRKCEEGFEEYASHIPKEFGFSKALQTNIQNFLFNKERNKMVFQEFVSRFNEQ